MITYVNTVLVSNLATPAMLSAAPAAATSKNTPSADAGKFVFMNLDGDATDTYRVAPTPKFRIGLVTNKNTAIRKTDGTTEYRPIVKWSNDIIANNIKSVAIQNKPADASKADTEDTAFIDFSNLDQAVAASFAEGGKRIIVRLTFKDLPTRFRKWTESYEYVTKIGDSVADIVTNIANDINAQYKRARVEAKAVNLSTANGVITATAPAAATETTEAISANGIQIVALPYDDDNQANTINWTDKVRFNVNIYWTNPAAEGWESLNKHFPLGVTITKEPGKRYVGMGKLVRDRENQAFGYQGIINRGNGTWPIIQPDMQADITKNYDVLTIEFENMYRAADDIMRKTKQTLEIYTAGTINAAFTSLLGSIQESNTFATTAQASNSVVNNTVVASDTVHTAA